jgi:hypothetical protein
MISFKLFPHTFRQFQNLIDRNKLIEEKILNVSYNPLTQRIFNLIIIIRSYWKFIFNDSSHIYSVVGITNRSCNQILKLICII